VIEGRGSEEACGVDGEESGFIELPFTDPDLQ
jgi:hypothetical protein